MVSAGAAEHGLRLVVDEVRERLDYWIVGPWITYTTVGHTEDGKPVHQFYLKFHVGNDSNRKFFGQERHGYPEGIGHLLDTYGDDAEVRRKLDAEVRTFLEEAVALSRQPVRP